MLRPIRTLLMMVVVFLAGYAFERYQHSTRCAQAGGHVVEGLCKGGSR